MISYNKDKQNKFTQFGFRNPYSASAVQIGESLVPEKSETPKKCFFFKYFKGDIILKYYEFA